mgnify:CR=1 FL=1
MIIILIVIFTVMLLLALWCALELAKRSDEQIELERYLNKKGK